MAWTITSHRMGFQEITATESAQTAATGLLGTQPPLGTICTAVDDAYNAGEFIFLRGVASTVPGDAVIYNAYAGTTTRTVAASRGPAAVALSSNVANQFAWYQISGQALVNCGTGVAAGALLYATATAGTLSSTSTTAQKLDGGITITAVGTPVAGQILVQMSRPSLNGNS